MKAQMKNVLLYKITKSDGHIYKLYLNGETEGFEPSSVIENSAYHYFLELCAKPGSCDLPDIKISFLDESMSPDFEDIRDSCLTIKVVAKHYASASFNDVVPLALREYADAVERGTLTCLFNDPQNKNKVMGRGAKEGMVASNGVMLKASYESCEVGTKDHSSNETPLASTLRRTSSIIETNL